MWWLIITSAVLLLIYCYGTRNHATFEKLHIPGPKSLPILGNCLHLIRYGFTGDTMLFKKYGRIFGHFEGSIPAIVISDVELVKLITIKYFDKFINRKMFIQQKFLNNAVTTLKNEDWKVVRNVITPTFTNVKLKKIAFIIDKFALDTVRKFKKYAESNEMFDVKNEIGSFTLNTLAETLFGVKTDEDPLGAQVLIRKANQFMVEFNYMKPVLFFAYLFPFTIPLFNWLDVGFFSNVTVEYFDNKFRTLISNRKSNPNEEHDDLLQLLIDARIDRKAGIDEKELFKDGDKPDKNVGKKRALTDDEMVSNSILLLMTGFESSTLAIIWMLNLLCLHQDVQEKVFDEIKGIQRGDETLTFESISKLTYFDQVFNETLPLYPTTLRFERVCNEDCYVNSLHIPKGMVISISVHAIHHDGEYWHNPEQFDPDRFSTENKDRIRPFAFLPFGAGPRSCVAMRLAVLVIKICVARILLAYKVKRCEKTEERPKLKHTGLCIPANGIWLKLEKRC